MLLLIPKACAKCYWCVIKYFLMQINLQAVVRSCSSSNNIAVLHRETRASRLQQYQKAAVQ
eukprot:17980-Heterococcus_DN1.PRE.2